MSSDGLSKAAFTQNQNPNWCIFAPVHLGTWCLRRVVRTSIHSFRFIADAVQMQLALLGSKAFYRPLDGHVDIRFCHPKPFLLSETVFDLYRIFLISFRDRQSKLNHKQNNHLHEALMSKKKRSSTRLICADCEEKFAQQKQLNKHRKPRSCGDCEAKINCPKALKEHAKTHEEWTPTYETTDGTPEGHMFWDNICKQLVKECQESDDAVLKGLFTYFA